MNIGNSFKILLISREMVYFECKSSISYTIFTLSRKYILIFICACEDLACIGTNGNNGACVLARKIHSSHDQLTSYTLPFKAFEDTRVVNDHPFRCCAPIGQFAYMHIVKPRLEKAISFRFCVFNG